MVLIPLHLLVDAEGLRMESVEVAAELLIEAAALLSVVAGTLPMAVQSVL
jgi:hypothetical protein